MGIRFTSWTLVQSAGRSSQENYRNRFTDSKYAVEKTEKPSIMISSVGKKDLFNRLDKPAKIIVDKSKKQSIMNISTEDNNVRCDQPKKVSHIMTSTKSTKAATIATAAALAATTAVASTAPTTATVAAAAAPVTKADLARPIFNSFLVDGKLTAERKVVIKAIMAGANLSDKGAATYYQNFKDKAGLVAKKAKPVVAEAATA